jgi:predicted dehydrogenase
MAELKNIGVMASDASAEVFRLDNTSSLNGYNVSKVWMQRSADEYVRTNYPLSEIVEDKQSIVEDNSIELVIVSQPLARELDLVSEVLAAGKQVRVI